MTSKKELRFAYFMAVLLLLIGGLCYAAFPVESPENPVRKLYKPDTGKVLFTHKNHNTKYGVSCFDCHHHYEEDESQLRACSDCHSQQEAMTVPDICRDCHEPLDAHHPTKEDVDESELRACNECHQLKEGEDLPAACTDCHEADEVESQEKIMNFQKRSDAFHTQCTSCHKEYGKGPLYEECNSCHVM